MALVFAPQAFGAKGGKRAEASTNAPEAIPRKFEEEATRPVYSKRFHVVKERVAKLKRTSFWNKRPYQFATPLVVGNHLYVGVDAGYFYAFSLDHGEREWVFQTGGPVHSKAASADGTIFVGDAKGVLYALAVASGKKLWATQLDSEILTAPLVLGSRVYVATMSGRLYALDAGEGTEQWHTATEEKEFGFSVRRAASPVESNGLIYVGSATGALRAFHASDGRLAWSQRIGDGRSQVYDVDATPLVSGGALYAASVDGTVVSLDPASGRERWAVKAGGVGDLIAEEGRLFTSGGGTLYALEPGSGKILWQKNITKRELSSPAAGDGFVAVAATQDKMYFFTGDTGEPIYEYYIRKGSLGDPSVAGDRVIILSNSSRLFTFRVERR